MASVQERLQIKREPLDKWSIREQLCLASAVARSGDQNWMSVSRALKPFGDPNRPPDWFHQKNCAAQYGALLENVETPKRKKRTSGSESVMETPAESILRKLTNERCAELKKLLIEEKSEYLHLQEEMTLLQSGNVSDEQLDKWCKEIDDEEQRKEQEAIAHAQWLKEREIRKQEIERAWRPLLKSPQSVVGQKRKASESIDNSSDADHTDDVQQTASEPAKPALSPLLTSLLKSPSQVVHVVGTSSILHSAITNQRTINTSANPTIASLLNSSTGLTVSPGIQQLVTTAISQEPTTSATTGNNVTAANLLEDAADTLPNLKVEDIESTILSSDEPLPEIKNEEVEVIISDLIESASADDIVNDPEQHLQLDGSEDIIANLENELKELCEEEEAGEHERIKRESKQGIKEEFKESGKSVGADKEIKIDPFEFEEEPDVVPHKPSSVKQQEIVKQEPDENVGEHIKIEISEDEQQTEEKDVLKKTVVEEVKVKEKREALPGSVEIVEVLVEDDELENKLNTSQMSQIQDIVHSRKVETETSVTADSSADKIDIKKELKSSVFDEPSDTVDIDLKSEADTKKEVTVDIDVGEPSGRNTFTPEYGEEFFDDLSIEVTKLDKSGKAKRDYSRTKKKEEKEIDILLAVEKAVNAQLEESELMEDTLSEKDYHDSDKKSESTSKLKIKNETERSNSPWTEEEEVLATRTRRRYSTPATPIDSVPNSPASSIAYFDDDRDYRNWKKLVLLVYSRLATHKYASLFMKPITDDQAHGYHNVIYRPMDLQTLRKNIENGTIRTTPEFQRDVSLMFTNAIMYNKTHSHIYNMAKQMQEESLEQIKILFQAQSQDLPVKRETRTSESGSKRKRGSEDSSRSKKRKED